MTFYAVGDAATAAGLTTKDDINEVMHDWESRYSSYSNSSIFITTFNVNGRVPALEMIPKWLTFNGDPPDFYAVGLQEMDLSPQAFLMNTSARHFEWQIVTKKSLPTTARYALVKEVRLVGILLMIYRRIDCGIKVNEAATEVEVVPTGFPLLGRMGNKGGVAISLQLNDSCICFVNSHFAAGQEELEKRNQDYRSGLRMFDRMLQTSYVDFQLKEQQKLNQVFVDFKEPDVLDFRPTYKYDPGTTRWDSSEKCRAPAWCDRILWWNRDGMNVRQLAYESVESVMFSDHKPVRAIFQVKIRTIDQAKRDACYEEAVREADRRANEALPQVELSQNDIDFGEVYFFQSASRMITIKNTGKTRIAFSFGARPNRTAVCEPWLSVTPPNSRLHPGATCVVSLQIDFGEVYFFQSASRMITIKNTGKTRIAFSFGARPNRTAVCEPWLSVTPPNSRLHPGATCVVSLQRSNLFRFQVLVDKTAAWAIGADGHLSEILVLRLHHGRHYFVTVSARYQHSVFGSSFIELVQKEKGETSATELVDLTFSPSSASSAVMVGIPWAVYRLGETLKQHGLEKIRFTDPSAHSVFVALRNALDTGTPANLFDACKSPFSMYDALLMLISAFKAQMQLLADVAFKRQAAEDGYLERSKFLETLVSYGQDSYQSTPPPPPPHQDRDLILL
ncbi:unnamed protein product [Gongylonema pulchrum]|uniref:IPPc domain-containing protein n=1 Tax=Gongylonema pulchrum TaxID=637853 RepID=A0A183DN61_9BILA|nr:unnamed protein product [Gongylonema pulchrum]